MKRKKVVVALSLAIPTLLEGSSLAVAAGEEATYPAASPPAEPGPPAPDAPSVFGSGRPPAAPTGGLPVTGSDLVGGLAIAGVAAVAIGYGLTAAPGRRGLGLEPPVPVLPMVGATGSWPDVGHRPGPGPGPGEARPGEGHRPLGTGDALVGPDALEQEGLLDGLDEPTRARLASLLRSAASSHRIALDDLAAVRKLTAASAPRDRLDRFADLGEHVAVLVQASHAAAAAELERAGAEGATLRAEAAASIARQHEEMDERLRRATDQLRLADEQAAARLAGARHEAEQVAAAVRDSVEARLGALRQRQDTLRWQLTAAWRQLEPSVEALAPSPGAGE